MTPTTAKYRFDSWANPEHLSNLLRFSSISRKYDSVLSFEDKIIVYFTSKLNSEEYEVLGDLIEEAHNGRATG